MKKLFIFLLTCILCFSAIAQNLTTYRPTKKFVSSIEVGIDFKNNKELSNIINVDYTAGLRVGNHWVLGIGTGFKAVKAKAKYFDEWKKNIGAIPVFFDAKCYLLNTKIQPLLRLRAGYNFLFQKPDYGVKAENGFQIDASVGVSWNRFLFVALNYREADYNLKSDLNRALGISLGATF